MNIGIVTNKKAQKYMGKEFRLQRAGEFSNAIPEGSQLLEEYDVGPVKVCIYENSGDGYYWVKEPPVEQADLELYNVLMNAIYFTIKPSDEKEPERLIEERFFQATKEIGIVLTPEQIVKFKYFILRDVLGYGLLDVLIKDGRIEDLSLSGSDKPVWVFHRDYSYLDWLVTNISFNDERDVESAIMLFAHKAKRHISTAFPISEGSLPERHRCALTFAKEVTPFGSSFTIRKFRLDPLTLCHLVKFGSISSLMAAYWWFLLENRGSIFVVGEMASGKTTLLNAVTSLLPPHWKIVTIEDTPELRLPHNGWKPLITRHTYSIAETKTEIRLYDLVKLSLRERAQSIVVGEIRGEEAYVFIQALATGHGGGCTFHGDSVESMVMRLTTPPIEASPSFLPLISNIVISRMLKLPNKKPIRRVVEVDEITGVKGPQEVYFNPIFKWHVEDDKHYPSDPLKVVQESSKLKKCGILLGMGEGDITQELSRRMNFIDDMVARNILEYDVVAEQIKKYYALSRQIR
jgi:flagellar protein FlaI